MAELQNRPNQPITLDQCLFGYDDGHRLLGSSLRLKPETASVLLRFSDLAAGLPARNVKPYWTGFPLQDEKAYALMRTWGAPELSRPGCVWTHVVFIKFEDLARIPDLRTLSSVFRRPKTPIQKTGYSEQIELGPELTNVFSDFNDIVDSDLLFMATRVLYGSEEIAAVFAEPEKVDGVVFNIWSQQWPKLRREFAFRTAGTMTEQTRSMVHFDLVGLTPNPNQPAPQQLGAFNPADWEQLAVNDAVENRATDFRKFLWRYGSDVHGGREIFRFLAAIYLNTRKKSFAEEGYWDLLLDIAKVLPDTDDGQTLKDDLIGNKENPYSLVPPANIIDLLRFYVRHPHIESLPKLNFASLDYQRAWRGNENQILDITEEAIRERSEASEPLLNKVAALIPSDAFFSYTNNRPNLRRQLVRLDPNVLDNDAINSLSAQDILDMLALVPNKDGKLVYRVVRHLMDIDNYNLALVLNSAYPSEVLRCVIDELNNNWQAQRPGMVSSWIKVVSASPKKFIKSDSLLEIQSTGALSVVAASMGYSNEDVEACGPIPWSKALKKARDDVTGKRREDFKVFLLSMALRNSVSGCEDLFEYSFDEIHSKLDSYGLSEDAQRIVKPLLPDVHWWNRSDMALQLRIAIAGAYVDNKLSRKSFSRLTDRKRVSDELFDIATETKRGRQYLGVKH